MYAVEYYLFMSSQILVLFLILCSIDFRKML